MSSKPSNFVTLDWLMPLFNEQLSQLNVLWQLLEQGQTDVDLTCMVEDYHQLSGAIKMANLGSFSQLAKSLSHLCQYLLDTMPADEISYLGHSGLFASEILQNELNYYALTGDMRPQLIQKSTEEIQQLLPDTYTRTLTADHAATSMHFLVKNISKIIKSVRNSLRPPSIEVLQPLSKEFSS